MMDSRRRRGGVTKREQKRLIAEVRGDQVPDVSHVPESERQAEAAVLRAQARAMLEVADALDAPGEVTDPAALRAVDREVREIVREFTTGRETQAEDAAAAKKSKAEAVWLPWVPTFEAELERAAGEDLPDPVGTARARTVAAMAEKLGREVSVDTARAWFKSPGPRGRRR